MTLVNESRASRFKSSLIAAAGFGAINISPIDTLPLIKEYTGQIYTAAKVGDSPIGVLITDKVLDYYRSVNKKEIRWSFAQDPKRSYPRSSSFIFIKRRSEEYKGEFVIDPDINKRLGYKFPTNALTIIFTSDPNFEGKTMMLALNEGSSGVYCSSSDGFKAQRTVNGVCKEIKCVPTRNRAGEQPCPHFAKQSRPHCKLVGHPTFVILPKSYSEDTGRLVSSYGNFRCDLLTTSFDSMSNIIRGVNQCVSDFGLKSIAFIPVTLYVSPQKRQTPDNKTTVVPLWGVKHDGDSSEAIPYAKKIREHVGSVKDWANNSDWVIPEDQEYLKNEFHPIGEQNYRELSQEARLEILIYSMYAVNNVGQEKARSFIDDLKANYVGGDYIAQLNKTAVSMLNKTAQNILDANV